METTELYMAFISIVSGVFMAVWLEPVARLFPHELSPREVITRVMSRDGLRGSLIFLILLCLWWWYAWFLGQIDPARGFVLFAFDFVTLCAFAMGFRF